jgi:hypothetical protein
MTPVQRVRRARTILAGTVVVAAVLWAAAAGMAALTLAALANTMGLVPAGAAVFANLFAAAAALGTVAAVLWRERAVWSVERVALWLEEHAPQLKYALVTVLDPRYAAAPVTGEGHTALLQATDRTDFERIVRRSAARTLAWAVAAAVLTGAVVSLLEATTTIGPLRGSRGGERPVKVLGNRLTNLRAEVIPPAYSGLPRQVVADPTAVAGLYGTQIRFLGEGPPDSVAAIVPKDTLAHDTVAAVTADDGWAVPVPMPKLPGVLRFEDRQYRRAVSLEPLPDSAPRLVLRRPANDTTWRWDQPPQGQLVLEADIEDDYGIASAFFEILLSIGSAENFETTDKSTPRVAFGGRRTGTLRATVNYRDLAMKQGSVLHIRAVAYDNNDVADSAGRGVSETRTLRVATKEEYDTSNVAPAPPLPIDSFFVSQRLLNLRTDTLTRIKKKSLAESQYRDTSLAYSGKQEDIRKRVEAVITIVEDDGVGGRIETDLSRLLRAASEEMYKAFTYLAIAMPDSAYVPPKSHMKEALRLLDEARKAQKYYIRGVLQARPVNVPHVRLKASETSAKAADRTARAIPEDVRRDLRERLAAVVPLAIQSPKAAVEPLLHVKSAALRGGATAVAAALQVAIDSAYKDRPTTAALARARRLLDPTARVTAGPVEWGGGVLP